MSSMSAQGVVERASAELSKRINGLGLRSKHHRSGNDHGTKTSVMERVTNVFCGGNNSNNVSAVNAPEKPSRLLSTRGKVPSSAVNGNTVVVTPGIVRKIPLNNAPNFLTWEQLMLDERFLARFFAYFSPSERRTLAQVSSSLVPRKLEEKLIFFVTSCLAGLHEVARSSVQIPPLLGGLDSCDKMQRIEDGGPAGQSAALRVPVAERISRGGPPRSHRRRCLRPRPFVPARGQTRSFYQSSMFQHIRSRIRSAFRSFTGAVLLLYTFIFRSEPQKCTETFFLFLSQALFELELAGCNEITEAGLWACLTPRIVALTLTDCINIADEAMGAVAQLLPSLYEFSLQAYHVSDAALGYFSPKQSNSLSILRLHSCWELTNHGVVNIGQFQTCHHFWERSFRKVKILKGFCLIRKTVTFFICG